MALTNAEKQKKYRERVMAKKRAELFKPSDVDMGSFSEWIKNNPKVAEFNKTLESGGISQRGNKFTLDHKKQNLLADAEIAVAHLIDAAQKLSSMINAYKLHEVEDRIKEIETSEKIDRKSAMKEYARLSSKHELLNRETRFSFSQWK